MKQQLLNSAKMLLMLLLTVAFNTKTNAQINLAPLATASAAPACNTGACSTLNDLNFGSCGTQQMWITSNATNPGSAVNVTFTWPTVQVINRITVHAGEANTRFMTGGTVQIFDGSNWITHHTFTQAVGVCQYDIVFPSVSCLAVRIIDITVGGTQNNNVNFREFEIWRGATAPNDAGVVSIDSPSVFVAGNQNIVAKVANFGVNQITDVTLNWSVNGILQTPVSYTGLLDTVGGTLSNSAQVTLGQVNFLNNTVYEIKSWTSNPNFSTDTVTSNDSTVRFYRSPLSGAYTVCQTGCDFTTISEAVNILRAGGMASPVTFNLNDPSYTVSTGEIFPINITNVPGLSASNPLVIKPQNLNNTIITDSNGLAIFVIDNAKYVTFDGRWDASDFGRNMTIENRGAAGTANVFIFRNEASANTIRNTIIRSRNNNTNTTPNAAAIFIGGTTNLIGVGNDSITIFNNAFAPSGGVFHATSIATVGQDQVRQNDWLFIDSNHFYGHRIYGFVAQFSNNGNGRQYRIMGNSFFDTTNVFPNPFPTTAFNFSDIRIESTNAGSFGHQIVGNYIGGQGPLCSGGRMFMSLSNGPSINHIFWSAGTAQGGGLIANNVLSNIAYNIGALTNHSYIVNQISVQSGVVDVLNNTVGSLLDTNNIVYYNNTGNTHNSFQMFHTGPTNIKHNLVSNISLQSNTANNYIALRMTGTTIGECNIDSNRVRAIFTRSNSTTAFGAFGGALVAYGISNGSPSINFRGNIAGGPNPEDSLSIFSSNPANPTVSVPANTRMCGIITQAGVINMANNYVGHLYTNSNASSNLTSSALVGIYNASGTGGNLFTNNTVSDLVSRTATAAPTVVNGMASVSAAATLTNNTIRNIINFSTNTSTTTAAATVGIFTSSLQPHTISNNIVRNLQTPNTGFATQTIGILGSISAAANITGNTVRELISGTTSTGTATGMGIVGINMINSSPNQVVENNQVYDLIATNDGSAVNTNIAGIVFTSSSVVAGNNSTVTRNRVWGLTHAYPSSGTPATAIQYGIFHNGGNVLMANNIIRMGIDTAGIAQARPGVHRGIFINTASTNQIRVLHNTVHVNYLPDYGTSGSPNPSTACFQSNGTPTSPGFLDVRNNIFSNTSANAGSASINHYLEMYAGPSNLQTTNNNMWFNPGTANHFIGRVGATNNATQNAFRQLIVQAGASGFANPGLLAPNASSSLINMNLSSTNPVEGMGDSTVIAFVTTDINGAARSGLTPTDIGALAGNFTLSVDSIAPLIFYTPLVNTVSPLNRTFRAIVYDGGLMPTDSLRSPRVYFRKPAQPTWQNRPGIFVGGGGRTLEYEFTIDHSAIGGILPGDIVQYYVIAADSPGVRINSNPAYAIATGVDNVITHPTNPNTYLFNDAIPTTVFIGPGPGTPSYPTLTGAGGFFAALNASALTDNTTVLVQGNVTEPGTNQLNKWLETGVGGYSLTIRPASATQVIISAAQTNTQGFIRFSNTDNVNILGWHPAGTPNDTNLIIRNTSTGALVGFIDGGSTDTVRNVVFEGRTSSTVSGMVFINASLTAATRGVSNVLIDNCWFRPDATTLPVNGVYSNSVSPRFNENIHVNNSKFISMNQSAVNFTTGSGNSLRVTNNHIYFAHGTHTNATVTPILMNMGLTSNGNVISGNFIGGTEMFAGGTPWINSNVSLNFNGISINTGSAAGSTVNNNRVRNFEFTGATTTVANGIFLQGTNANYSAIGNNVSDFLTVGNHRFNGIQTSTTGNITLENDTVMNINVNNAGTTAALTGILSINITSGIVAINNNVVRNLTTSSTNTGTVATTLALVGIATSNGTLNQNINNNLVQSLTSTANAAVLVRGMWLTGGTPIINGNTVRGINVVTTATGTLTTAGVVGILASSPTNGFMSMNNNIVDSIWRTGTASSVQMIGLAYNPAGISQTANVIGNQVTNLNIATNSTGVGTAAGLIGILINASGTLNANYTDNRVSVLNHLSNSNTTTTGIHLVNSTALTGNQSLLSRNLVHSLRSDAIAPTVPTLQGINIGTAFITVSNNMIRLGIDSAGVLYTEPRTLRGIYFQTSVQSFFYNNTILLAGAPSSGAASTFGFENQFQISVGQQLEFRNNIVSNRVTNTGTATGFNFGVRYQDSLRVLSNHNIIFADGVGAVHGGINATNTRYVLLGGDSTSWQAVTGLDMASASVNPNFTASALNAAPNVLLTLSANNPAERSGDPTVPVTVDYFNNARAGLTPSDIGAHADNFNQVPDAVAPQITFAPLTNAGSIIGSRTLTGVSITDNNGIVMSGSNRPRIYYSNDNGLNWQSAGATVVSGTATNATAEFVIDYLTFTTPLTTLDTIIYFVVAQDLAGNLGSFPRYAVGTSVGAITQFPRTPSRFNFLPVIPANTVLSVGVGQTFTSLTNAGGVFEFINNRTLGGNITVEVTSDISGETGAIALNRFAEDGPGAGTFTLTIRPNAATTSIRTIQGSFGATNSGFGLITLLGADRVKFVGIPTGGNNTQRLLRIRNTAVTGAYAADAGSPTITVSSASGVAIRNCIVETGNSSTSNTGGAIAFRAGIGNLFVTTPCSFDTVTNCILTNNTAATLPNGIPASLVGSFGLPNVFNNNIVISDNLISNFTIAGIGILGNNGDGFRITNNSLFYNLGFVPFTIAGTSVQAIVFLPGAFSTNNLISGNFIGGSAPLCGGTPFVNPQQQGYTGIRVSVGNGLPTVVTNNTVQNIHYTNAASTSQFQGIVNEGGNTSITNNQIGHPTITNSISYAPTGTFFGVRNFGGQQITIQNNTVQGIILPTPNSFNQFFGVDITAGIIVGDVSGNIVGSTTVSNSVTVASNTTSDGIRISVGAFTTPVYNLVNNTVANITSLGTGTSAILNGINIGNSAQAFVLNNQVFELRAAGTSTATNGVVRGINISGSSTTIYTLENNTVNGIRLTNTSAAPNISAGMMLTFGIMHARHNRIYDITNASTSTSLSPVPMAIGIAHSGSTPSGSMDVFNNQITLGTGVSDPVQYVGIWNNNNNSAHSLNIFNNSVLIQGASSGGAQNTYAYLQGNNQAAFINSFPTFRNNILANTRTGGSGNHYAIAHQNSAPSNANWGTTTSAYNLLVTANTNTVGEWGVGPNNIAAWRTNSTSDVLSYYVQSGTGAGQLNIANLFTNPATGNLGLQTANSEVWYVFGKGITGAQINNLNRDYAGNARSTSQGTATTIGSIHMTAAPSMLPIAATASAAPAANTTTNYTFASRPVASISWGASAPSSAIVYDFTGVNPPASPAGNFNNRYVRVDVAGGTPPYNFGLSYNFNAANLGSTINGNNIRLATSNLAVPTSWTTQFTTLSSSATGVATVSGLTGTGPSITFTGTELTAPPTITSVTPSAAPVGATVSIRGSLFTGATAVVFNGTNQPTFTVVNDTIITTTVPVGATTGPIAITNPFGTTTSTFNVTVIPAPTIASFTPSNGTFGTNVTIIGTGFTWATGVRFNGVNATFNVVNNTTINATVPNGATSGTIRVVNPADSVESLNSFTVFGVPVVTSFTPATGPAGTLVTIDGSGFNAITAVRFNGVNASYSVVNPTQITATVPSGASTGPISVLNASGTGTSGTNYVVTTPPTITGFTPSSGGPGATVVISGTNFIGTDSVQFNGATTLAFTVNSSTQITATVPAAATTGVISVFTSQGSANSTGIYTVIPDLIVSTVQGVSGTYNNITVTGTGVATLTGTLTALGNTTIQSNGRMNFGTEVLNGIGNFTAQASSVIEVGSPDGISLAGNNGNIQVNGTRTFNPGMKVVYNAAANQNTGNAIANIDTVVVAVTGNLSLQTNATVNRLLEMGNGVLVLGSNNLTIGSTGSITGASSSSYIRTNSIGTLNRTVANNATNVNFPVGTSDYTPMQIQFTAPSTTDVVSVRVVNGVLSGATTGTPINTSMVNRTWLVSEAVQGGSNATITLTWDDTHEVGGFSRTQSAISRFQNNEWTFAGVTFGPATGVNPYSRSLSGITTLQAFTVGDTFATPLPVNFVGVKAIAMNDDVNVVWSTAGESNNRGFFVQRSVDAVNFEDVDFVNGTNTSALMKYSFNDRYAFSSTGMEKLYYRIRQIDFDGTESYSIVVSAQRPDRAFTQVDAKPNPFTRDLNLEIVTAESGNVTISITDIQGRVVANVPAILSRGVNTLQINELNEVKAGVYFIRISGTESTTIKVVKTN